MERTCSKPNCMVEATFTVTIDYPGLAAAVGPLSPSPSVFGTDLCTRHALAFTVPDGWVLMRHLDLSGDY
jgi:hypothetical protein